MGCCGGGSYKRSRNTGRGVSVSRQQFKRAGKYQRFVKQGQKSMASHPEVEAVPVIYKAEPVTPPKYEDCDPTTGLPLSVLKTGVNPANVIPQPLPEAVNPVVIEANEGQAYEGGEEKSEGESGVVTKAGGES